MDFLIRCTIFLFNNMAFYRIAHANIFQHTITQKLNSTHGNLSLDFANFAKGAFFCLLYKMAFTSIRVSGLESDCGASSVFVEKKRNGWTRKLLE